MNIKEKLEDLYKQSTQDRSHFYVGSVVREAIDAITRLGYRVSELDENESALVLEIDAKDRKIDEYERLLSNIEVWNLLRHGYKSPTNYLDDDLDEDDHYSINDLYDISSQLRKKIMIDIHEGENSK